MVWTQHTELLFLPHSFSFKTVKSPQFSEHKQWDPDSHFVNLWFFAISLFLFENCGFFGGQHTATSTPRTFTTHTTHSLVTKKFAQQLAYLVFPYWAATLHTLDTKEAVQTNFPPASTFSSVAVGAIIFRRHNLPQKPESSSSQPLLGLQEDLDVKRHLHQQMQNVPKEDI